MIIFKLNLFMHKKRIKTNIFGVSLKRQALYPYLRHILQGTPKTKAYLAITTTHTFWLVKEKTINFKILFSHISNASSFEMSKRYFHRFNFFHYII